MPALVCLSPVLADHSFPRYPEQLTIVAVALGKLAEMTADRRIQVVRTQFFSDLVGAFTWKPNHPLKGDILRHLANWFLVGGTQTIRLDVSEISKCEHHPLPLGSDADDGFQALWAEDTGKLLGKHDAATGNGGYCIGVACEYAFAKRQLNTYSSHSCRRFFPLVGPETCDCTSSEAVLEDAWEFEIPEWAETADVSLNEAYSNLHAIGASTVRKPGSGSHYIAQFSRGRSWTLDRNYDPVLPQYLAQLPYITGYPITAIRYALKTGELPKRRLRLGLE